MLINSDIDTVGDSFVMTLMPKKRIFRVRASSCYKKWCIRLFLIRIEKFQMICRYGCCSVKIAHREVNANPRERSC